MYDEAVLNPSQLPLPQSSRHSTDLCCIFIALLFFAGLASTLLVSTFPLASSKPVCSDVALYLSEKDPICLTHCPNEYIRIGSLCLPRDPSKRTQFFSVYPDLQDTYTNWSRIRTAIITAALCLLISLSFSALMFLAPAVSIGLMTVGSPLLFLWIAVDSSFIHTILGFHLQGSSQLALSIACLLIALAIILYSLLEKREVQFEYLMLRYSSQQMESHPTLLMAVFVKIVGYFGAVALLVCLEGVFLKTSYFRVLTALNLLAFLWLIQFFSDFHTYWIGGKTTDSYWQGRLSFLASTKRLCRNVGSVIGGSFMRAFFGWFFLARSDAYAMLHLTGLPYCDAARECQIINILTKYSILNRLRALSGLLGLAVALILGNLLCYGDSIFSVLWTVLTGYLLSNTFPESNIAVAEALQTSVLTERMLVNEGSQMRHISPAFLREFLTWQEVNAKTQ